MLIDLGSAERLSDLDYTEVIVTPGFSAPERYASGGDIGTWSDVYSCAATPGAAIAGAVPPEAGAAPGAVAAFLDADRPQWLAGIEHGLRANIGERTADIGVFRSALGLAGYLAAPRPYSGLPNERWRERPSQSVLNFPSRSQKDPRRPYCFTVQDHAGTTPRTTRNIIGNDRGPSGKPARYPARTCCSIAPRLSSESAIKAPEMTPWPPVNVPQ